MKTYGIEEAKRHFCKIARQVEQGEPCLVTRRGRAIMQLLPLLVIQGDKSPKKEDTSA